MKKRFYFNNKGTTVIVIMETLNSFNGHSLQPSDVSTNQSVFELSTILLQP